MQGVKEDVSDSHNSQGDYPLAIFLTADSKWMQLPDVTFMYQEQRPSSWFVTVVDFYKKQAHGRSQKKKRKFALRSKDVKVRKVSASGSQSEIIAEEATRNFF